MGFYNVKISFSVLANEIDGFEHLRQAESFVDTTLPAQGPEVVNPEAMH